MIIQIGHAQDSQYQSELYEPIKNASFFTEHTWIFPHDGVEVDSKESLKNIDLFIAEVSTPAIGLGIEIGFACVYGKTILCISKKGTKISSSLARVTDNFIEYENPEDIIGKIGDLLKFL